MSEWKDVSSYSRDDKVPEVKSVESRAGLLRIIVTRHIHHPGLWILRCEPYAYEHPLQAKELELAKHEALSYVGALLAESSEIVSTELAKPTREGSQ